MKKRKNGIKADSNMQIVTYENKENAEDSHLAIENVLDEANIINYNIKEVAIPENKSRQLF